MSIVPRLWILITAAVAAVFAALFVHVQWQPSGYARIYRAGKRLGVSEGRIGWSPRYFSSCLAPVADGKILFNATRQLTTSDELLLPVRLTFRYSVPREAPAWTGDDWCSGLTDRAFGVISSSVSRLDGAKTASQPRTVGNALAAQLADGLRKSGIPASEVSVRFEVDPLLRAAAPVAEIASRSRLTRPVIFIGLDGADWELLDRYMASGKMPTLSRLVTEGRRGVLETQHPPLSPLLWTTMMTGVGPLKHQILDFTRFNPVTRVKEPITSDERRVPAIWNMATQAGKRVAVFGLWATYPAEPLRGVVVSDRLFSFLYSADAPSKEVVFPPSRDRWARNVLQSVEKEIGLAPLRRYFPWLTEQQYGELIPSKTPYEHPVSALHRILVETEVYHRLAIEYLRQHKPALTILYIQGTDSIGHVFAPFHPPRQSHISPEDYERYSEVPERYFQRVDELLRSYAEVAERDGAVLMIASDHGFRWFEGRPARLSSFAAATAAKWHRKEGIYLVWEGARSRREEGSGRGGIQQVCATLLALLALPPASQSDDQPLAGVAPVSGGPADYHAHYTPPRVSVVVDASEEIAKLRALGYITPGESLQPPPGKSSRTAGSFNNEGLIHRDAGRVSDALTAFETAISIDPNLASALWNLSDLLFARKRDLDRSDALLVRALGSGLPDGVKFVIGRAIGYQRSGLIDRSVKLLEGSVNTRPDDAELLVFRGRYRVDVGDCSGALSDFLAVQRINPRDPFAYASAGLAALCAGDKTVAVAQFRRSLSLNPDQPRVRAYLERLQ